MHLVMGEMPKSISVWVYLPHKHSSDDRDEEFEDSYDDVRIDFSVAGSYCCTLER